MNAEIPESINRVTESIIGAAIEMRRENGPDLLESAYEHCLAHELEMRGHRVARQEAIPLEYKGATVDVAFRVDMIVDDRVLVEWKAIETVQPVRKAQVLSCVRETDARIALLISFHASRLVNGVTRIVNDRASVTHSAASVLKNQEARP